MGSQATPATLKLKVAFLHSQTSLIHKYAKAMGIDWLVLQSGCSFTVLGDAPIGAQEHYFSRLRSKGDPVGICSGVRMLVSRGNIWLCN